MPQNCFFPGQRKWELQDGYNATKLVTVVGLVVVVAVVIDALVVALVVASVLLSTQHNNKNN